MIISFDIDDTLCPSTAELELEERTIWSKLLNAESLRKGTPKLFKELERKGHDIYIYTTSFRSIFYLRRTFIAYGLSPKKIINEKLNRQQLSKENCTASKNPKLFGIDLHVDDSLGVLQEGKQHGFKTIIVETKDQDWVEKILKGVAIIELNLEEEFERLVMTLIAMKSTPKRQREIYGVDQAEEEMINDFDSYYTLLRDSLLAYAFLNNAIDAKLNKLDAFVEKKSKDKANKFWESLETSPDWEKIRSMATEILMEMGKDDLHLKVKHTHEIDEYGNIEQQITESKLVKNRDKSF